MMLRAVSAVLLTGFFLSSCSPESPPGKSPASGGNTPAPAAPVTPVFPALPVDFTVKQRSTSGAPGFGEELLVTIGDITRGQTMVTLAGKDASLLLPTRSMKQGTAAEFKFGGETLTLTLRELDNALIGTDTASFIISRGPAKLPPDAAAVFLEQQKIKRLLEHIEGMEGATFVRNGADHTPKEAAEHLGSKLTSANLKTMTARGFIENIASKSLVTSEVYTIRLKDGTTVPAGEYLGKELDKIERE